MAQNFVVSITLQAKDQASAVIGKIGGTAKGAGAAITANAQQLRQIGGVMTGVGGAIIGTLSAAAVQTANWGDEIAKTSTRLGISTEEMSRLKYAADRSGVGLEALAGGMGRLQRSAYEASQGTATQAEAFQKLGVSVTDADGQLKDTNTLMLETAQAISQVQNPTERSAVAMELFGRAGAQMLPMLNQGSAGIQALGDRAAKLGLIFGQDDAKAAEEFNDALADLKDSGSALFKQLGVQIIPTFARAASGLADLVGVVNQFGEAHPILMKTGTLIAGGLGMVLGVLGPIVAMLPSMVSGFAILKTTFAAVPAIVGGIGPAITGAFAAIGPAGWVILAIAAVAAGVYLVIKHWGAIKGFFSKLWGAVVNTFKSSWDIILAVVFPPMGIPMMIMKRWDVIGPWFSSLWDKVKGIFRSAWEWIKNAGANLWGAFVDGLKATAMLPINAVVSVLKKIREYLPFSDAKAGPFMDLAASGAAFGRTWAEGVRQSKPQMEAVVQDVFGVVAAGLAGVGVASGSAGGMNVGAVQDVFGVVAAGSPGVGVASGSAGGMNVGAVPASRPPVGGGPLPVRSCCLTKGRRP